MKFIGRQLSGTSAFLVLAHQLQHGHQNGWGAQQDVGQQHPENWADTNLMHLVPATRHNFFRGEIYGQQAHQHANELMPSFNALRHSLAAKNVDNGFKLADC